MRKIISDKWRRGFGKACRLPGTASRQIAFQLFLTNFPSRVLRLLRRHPIELTMELAETLGGTLNGFIGRWCAY